MRRVQPRFEEVGGQRLPLGGINGYRGVRGKQGRNKDKFQGITPKKKHRTRLSDTAQDVSTLCLNTTLSQVLERLNTSLSQLLRQICLNTHFDCVNTCFAYHSPPTGRAHRDSKPVMCGDD